MATDRDRVYYGLRKRGFDHAQASGIMGNIAAESSFTPTAFNPAGGGQGAHGLFQWRGDRWQGLQRQARERGVSPYDIDNQLDFMKWEMDNTETNARDRLEGITDPIEYAKVFRDEFERPGGHGYTATDKGTRAAYNDYYQPNAFGVEPLADVTSHDPLRDFAAEMSDSGRTIARQIRYPATAEQMEQQARDNPYGVTTGEPLTLDQFRNENLMAPPMNATMGTPLGMADIQLPFAQPNQVTPGVSTQGMYDPGRGNGLLPPPAEGEEEPTGWLGRIAGNIFKDAEDPEAELRNRLRGFGVALGQMSSGQAVNLAPFWSDVARRQQAIVDSQNMEQWRDEQLAIQDRNTRVAEVKAGLEAAQLSSGVAVPWSAERMTNFYEDPDLAPFAEMIATGDKESVKTGTQGIKEILVDRATNAATADPNTARGNARFLEAVGRDAPPSELSTIMAEEEIEPVDAKRLYDMVSEAPTGFVKDMQAYQDALVNNPELAKSMEKRWMQEGGFAEDPSITRNRERAYERSSQLNNVVKANGPMDAELYNMRELTKQAIKEEYGSGPFNDIFINASNALRQVVGGDTAEAFGQLLPWLNSEQINNLSQLGAAESALALMIAGPLMEGGGQISDGERAIMLKTIAQGGMSHGTRLQMIDKLESLNRIDRAAAEYYANNLDRDTFANQQTLFGEIQRESGQAVKAIMIATQYATARRYGKVLPEFGNVAGDNVERATLMGSPQLTARQFELFGSAITPKANGMVTWRRMNEDGTQTLMNGNEVLREL